MEERFPRAYMVKIQIFTEKRWDLRVAYCTPSQACRRFKLCRAWLMLLSWPGAVSWTDTAPSEIASGDSDRELPMTRKLARRPL